MCGCIFPSSSCSNLILEMLPIFKNSKQNHGNKGKEEVIRRNERNWNARASVFQC